MHRSPHDCRRSLSWLVLSPGRAATELRSWLGNSNVARRCAASRHACACDQLEAAWANIRAQAAYVPYGSIRRSLILYFLATSAIGFRIASPMNIGQASTSARASSEFKCPRCTSQAGTTPYLEGSVAGYMDLRKHAGSTFARANQCLLAGTMGPHPVGRPGGRFKFGEAANLNTDEILLRWFDHWLKDSSSFSAEPRIRYFVSARTNGVEASDWPTDAAFPPYSAAREMPTLAKGTARSRTAFRPAVKSLATFTALRPPEVARARPGRTARDSQVHSINPRWNWATICSSTRPHRSRITIDVFGHPRIASYATTSAPHADFIGQDCARARRMAAPSFSPSDRAQPAPLPRRRVCTRPNSSVGIHTGANSIRSRSR